MISLKHEIWFEKKTKFYTGIWYLFLNKFLIIYE